MGIVMEEDEIWKCRKHPSRRRAVGVCPICLRDRLVSLCPNCANVRPCACCSIGGATTTSSASSTATTTTTSSSFSLSSSSDLHRSGGGGVGAVGRVASLIEKEPAFRRSRSAAFPFLRLPERDSGGSGDSSSGRRIPPPPLKEDRQSGGSRSSSSSSIFSIWSVFRSSKTKRKECCDDVVVVVEDEDLDRNARRNLHRDATLMTRSKSAGGASGCSDPARLRGRSWYFPSPMKVFRHHSKTSKIVHERSPLCRG
ncbi:hypothetical protein Scep_026954 [Stephania cephalantha]|uniref:Uncharacterized protein n=1 Tax=Stephania cephalantha TaxID=152367 RepID=A0AAP0EL40_9MAGN